MSDFSEFLVLMAMVETFLRQLGKLLQMKKIITNTPCALQFANRTNPAWLKKSVEDMYKQRCDNLTTKSFTVLKVKQELTGFPVTTS